MWHEFVEVSSLSLWEGAIGAPIDRTRLRGSTNTRQRQHYAIAIGNGGVSHLELHAEQRWQRCRFGGAHEAHRARERALIDEGESAQSERNSLRHQLLGRSGRA